MAVWYAVMDCFSWPTWLTWPLDAPSASSCGPNEIAEKSPFPEAPSRAKQCDCPADSSSKNWWNCEITCSAWWPIPKWLERLAAEIIPGQDCLDTLHGPVISDAQGLLELQGSDCPAWLATLQCRNGGCSPPTAPFKHHCKICKHWISCFFFRIYIFTIMLSHTFDHLRIFVSKVMGQWNPMKLPQIVQVRPWLSIETTMVTWESQMTGYILFTSHFRWLKGKIIPKNKIKFPTNRLSNPIKSHYTWSIPNHPLFPMLRQASMVIALGYFFNTSEISLSFSSLKDGSKRPCDE